MKYNKRMEPLPNIVITDTEQDLRYLKAAVFFLTHYPEQAFHYGNPDEITQEVADLEQRIAQLSFSGLALT